MIKDLKIKQKYEVYNLIDFIRTFKLEKEAFKKYNVEEYEDIYELGYCDEDEIEEFLESYKDRYFTFHYSENYSTEGIFYIQEYEKEV